jgi:hypothetical protein
LSKREKEREIDVGRSTTLSPNEEKPDQVLPNVTVQYSKESGEKSGSGNDEGTTIAEENGQIFLNTEYTSSPKEEISLEIEKAMQEQAKEA